MAVGTGRAGTDVSDADTATQPLLDGTRGPGDGAGPTARPGSDPVALLASLRDLLGARSRTEVYTRAVYTARCALRADAALWTGTVGDAASVRACAGLVEPTAFARTTRELPTEALLPGVLLTEGMASGFGVPVPACGGDAEARIFVLSRAPGGFTGADVELLTEISRFAGAAAALIGEVEDHHREAAVLEGAVLAAGAGRSIDEVVSEAAGVLGFEVRADLPRAADTSPPAVPYAAVPSAAHRPTAMDDELFVPVPHSRLVLRAPRAHGAAHHAALRRLAGVLGIAVSGRRAEFDRELRVHGAFIEELVSGLGDRLEAAAGRCRLLGVDLGAPHALVALGGDSPVERPVLDRVATRLLEVSPGSVLSSYRGCVVILWPLPAQCAGEDPDGDDLRRAVSLLLDAAAPSRLFAGISRVCRTLEGYRDSLRESMFSLHVARHGPGRSRVTLAQELGMFQIAAYIVGSGAERKAVERVLGRLLHADRRLKSDLLNTLRTYLVHERRAGATARALFIHPNTLRYRLEQIRENLDLDLDDADARFELMAALQLESILRTLRPDGDNSASRLGRLVRPAVHAPHATEPDVR